MHIILAVLGSIITILVLLNRLKDAGIDVGWLNPFLWQRRRAWKKKYMGNPAYTIESPMEALALAMLTTAKLDGDLSLEEKNGILNIFQSDFHLSRNEATNLLSSTSYLLNAPQEIAENIESVFSRSRESFSHQQVTSSRLILEKVSNIGGAASREQIILMERVEKYLSQSHPKSW